MSTMSRVALASLLVAAVTGCAGSPGREKGRLAPVADLRVEEVAEAVRPRKVALLVGVDTFDDPFWPALRYASKDARDLSSVLADPDLGAFDEVRVVTGERETGLDGLREALDRLAAMALRPEDTVVVYLSSHGTLAPTATGNLERILVTRDTRSHDLFRTGLRITELGARFEALPSRRKLLVLATCHGGGGKSLLTAEADRALAGLKGVPVLEVVSRGSIVLAAAELGRPAREDDRLRNDVYTHFLIEALREGADPNGDGAVTATEAHDFARRRTFEFTEGHQIPTVQSEVVGADPVILAGAIARPGLPVLFSYAAGLSGYEVRVDGRTKGVLPGNVVLGAGRREVSLVRGDTDPVFTGRVELRAGQRVSAEALIDRARPRWTVSVRAGGLAMLEPELSHALMPGLAVSGLALRLRDRPFRGLDPILDLSWGSARQHVTPVDSLVEQRTSVLRIGAGAAVSRDLGPFRFHAGPRLSFVSIGRRVELEGLAEAQGLATMMPGLTAGVAWSPSLRLDLHLEVQTDYLPLILDGEVRSVALGSVSGGVGVRF